MRVLIAAATAMEVAPLHANLGGAAPAAGCVSACAFRDHAVDLLVTGVGMVATAAWCARTLAGSAYDLAINVGVCGSFDQALAPGAVVHIIRDRIAELGAEDGDAFLSIEDLNLLGPAHGPFARAELVNDAPPANSALNALPRVSAITVNTVHGNARSIAAVTDRFHPQVESMEGAAFMYACIINRLPFAQVRAVSNIVEPRNRAAWRLGDAVDHVCAAAIGMLDAL